MSLLHDNLDKRKDIRWILTMGTNNNTKYKLYDIIKHTGHVD